MANQQVREILDEARAFHAQLGESYRQTADRSGRERLRMLLYYLGRHEEHLAEALKGYAAEGRKQVLDSWIPSKSVEHLLTQLQLLTTADQIGLDDLVERALRYDDHLITFFKLMAEKAPDEAVRNLFLALVRMEERAERVLARDTIDFSDL
jgi:rubrerythrin